MPSARWTQNPYFQEQVVRPCQPQDAPTQPDPLPLHFGPSFISSSHLAEFEDNDEQMCLPKRRSLRRASNAGPRCLQGCAAFLTDLRVIRTLNTRPSEYNNPIYSIKVDVFVRPSTMHAGLLGVVPPPQSVHLNTPAI